MSTCLRENKNGMKNERVGEIQSGESENEGEMERKRESERKKERARGKVRDRERYTFPVETVEAYNKNTNTNNWFMTRILHKRPKTLDSCPRHWIPDVLHEKLKKNPFSFLETRMRS